MSYCLEKPAACHYSIGKQIFQVCFNILLLLLRKSHYKDLHVAIVGDAIRMSVLFLAVI
jgi:hypothetical protein